jgi:hypothetical protein
VRPLVGPRVTRCQGSALGSADVASNVAIPDRLDIAGRGATSTDLRAHIGTRDVLPTRFLRCVAVGYDRTWVASTGQRWTRWTVRRVHGM